MKVTLLTTNLQAKLPYVNHAISQKSQLPVLVNMLFETHKDHIVIKTTDLEIGIEVTIPATISEEGSVTVPAKSFTELVSSLSEDTITLTATASTLTVQSKKTKSTFQTLPSEDFPSLYEEKGSLIATMQDKNLHKEIASVIFAASTDTTRPALSGVLVRKEEDGFLLVATDGYRLSLRHYKLPENASLLHSSFIIPAKVFKELSGIKEETEELSMYISQDTNQVLFEQGKTVLVGRLIESEFPQFEKIIPSDFSVSVTFDREEMLKAVKICAIFARDAANIIKFSLKKEQIIVSSQSSSVGENTVEVDATLTGEENEIAFNARYLLDFLATIDAKQLTFEMTGPLNPGVFKVSDDASYLHLIMPIRVQE